MGEPCICLHYGRGLTETRVHSADCPVHRDPPCPSCGLTSQVEPSRSEPGRFMCHGCAQPFDAAVREQEA